EREEGANKGRTEFSGRRTFIKTSLAAVTGTMLAPTFIPARALGLEGRPAPSDRITLGFIGVGSMGSGNLRGFRSASDTQVLALCDVDRRRLASAKAETESFYAQQQTDGTYHGCSDYVDFRQLVARQDIDAVVISTPDHWHVLPSIAAVRMGKDVYCEKPLSLTIAEGRALSDAVKRHGRVFQTGSQQRSSQNFRLACELVRNGRIGKLHTIEVLLSSGKQTTVQPPQPVPAELEYNLWLGQAPEEPYTSMRCHYNFRFIRDYSGGQLTNWGAHHLDIAQWGHGSDHSGPVQVQGTGTFPSSGLWNNPTQYQIEYTYSDGVKVICKTSGSSVRFIGTEGEVYVSRERLSAKPLSILESPIASNEIHLYDSRNHHRNFLDCIKTRRETAAPVETAHRTITMAHLGNIAMLLGRTLKWNPDTERFVDDPGADRMLSRSMRKPWHL
ncbi:MAG TPA: Gfo/Idh/MocA family oxidoreductase, partial [bacterium]|nr:Gfo/Idh/MocA family oxidoreductase [bacterium]